MRLALVFHQADLSDDQWSTPLGLGGALEQQGVDVIPYPFVTPDQVQIPTLAELQSQSITAVLVCYAGPAAELDRQLLALRLQIDQQQLAIYLICELGDEPQTRWCNASRVQASHLSLSPDAPSVRYWRALGANCLWFTHWADTTIFRQDEHADRLQFVVTTMGRRRYARRLAIILGRRFRNRRCFGSANRAFYSSGQVAFQYARWHEITRRVFEAAACGCCVLTNRLPLQTRMEELFPGDQAIVYYDGFIGLCVALWRLYRDPAWRLSIAQEGQRRVLQMHTQHTRASQLIDALQSLCSAGGTV